MDEYSKKAYKLAVLEAVIVFIDTTEFFDEEFLPQSQKKVPESVTGELLDGFDTMARELRDDLGKFRMRRADEQLEAKERKAAPKRPAAKASKARAAKRGGAGKSTRATRRKAK